MLVSMRWIIKFTFHAVLSLVIKCVFGIFVLQNTELIFDVDSLNKSTIVSITIFIGIKKLPV